MPHDTANSNLSPAQPLSPQDDRLARAVTGLLDGQAKDGAQVERALEGMDNCLEAVAVRYYTIASMLVGEGEDAIGLVESAVAGAEVSSATEPEQVRHESRRALAAAAVALLTRRDPSCLAAPQGLAQATTCIDDDDLDSAGMSRDELDSMLAADRDRVRAWLESLATPMRVIFVLRAIAGLSAPETAAVLSAHAGPKAAGWSPEPVRELFRQALCSLASQMLKAGSRE